MTKRGLPAPFYAAAGVGDLAYQRLRKLPEAAERTLRVASESATTLRERVAAGESRLDRDRLTAELAKLRESAQRGATAFVSSAAVAQEKAVTGYRKLVAHGEQVVAARNGSGTEATVPASEIEAAAAAEPVAVTEVEAEAAVTPEPSAAPAGTSKPAARKSTAGGKSGAAQ
jgi:heparin binding hemagglutinin HbhA